jgi:hypothetical protein
MHRVTHMRSHKQLVPPGGLCLLEGRARGHRVVSEPALRLSIAVKANNWRQDRELAYCWRARGRAWVCPLWAWPIARAGIAQRKSSGLVGRRRGFDSLTRLHGDKETGHWTDGASGTQSGEPPLVSACSIV